ncbi:MAG: hypothetical protein M1366_01645 [Patescibacteria group bacterium]|nr:hypothetical protein [Patescibacteria group bacterium]
MNKILGGVFILLILITAVEIGVYFFYQQKIVLGINNPVRTVNLTPYPTFPTLQENVTPAINPTLQAQINSWANTPYNPNNKVYVTTDVKNSKVLDVAYNGISINGNHIPDFTPPHPFALKLTDSSMQEGYWSYFRENDLSSKIQVFINSQNQKKLGTIKDIKIGDTIELLQVEDPHVAAQKAVVIMVINIYR